MQETKPIPDQPGTKPFDFHQISTSLDQAVHPPPLSSFVILPSLISDP